MESSARVSVIIVTHNGRSHLPDLRCALTSQLTERDEVIILDNASSDETADWIEQEWPQAKLIRSSRNLKFAAGNNVATMYAAGEVLLYLNQDTIPDENLVEIAASQTKRRQALTFAQQFPWSSGRLVPYMDWSGVTLWREPQDDVEATNVLSGAAFSLHRSTLGELGGLPFDGRIPHCCEDTNLSLNLESLGTGQMAVSATGLFHDSTPSKGNRWQDFIMATSIQRNLVLAFLYAYGWKTVLRRLPRLLLAGWRKADVDGKGTFPRRVGLTLATWIGLAMVVLFPRPKDMTVSTGSPLITVEAGGHV